ncbi:MAG: amino acid permease [Bacteroidia bacterium]|nr:amino acid permease [Bacteroidia bacterium]
MAKVNKFGTFGGVFTPSILTILGVIMYLRLPMIVGEAGLWATLGIIIIAHIISVTTGLSVSSIATDKKVEAGGTYFMISRSLGLPIGGTLGLALFVGLSFSVSLYLIGFSESFLSYWGYEVTINSIRLTGTIILVVVTTITLISTSLAIKTQYFIMVAIILSLISIFTGNHEFGPQATSSLNVIESPTKALPFMLLFGIFFPAVTGFEAGVSMSGDLKDPKRSIPTGSIVAIGVGFVVYILLAIFLAFTVNGKLLTTDSQILLKISWIPELVIAGIWGATLSSALGSILGAPRILQATAVDKISPRFFSKGVGVSNEPRNALLLTFVIAEAGILIGELDVIARIVSIFFITTYGFLNLSCAFERWTSADFRPTFKTPVWVSLFGASACFIVMIELDFIATLGAIVILSGLYLYLKRKELALQTGDAWGGVWSLLAKTALQRLTSSKQHTRNWRPNILMFNGADQARPFMLGLGEAISGKLGLLSSFELVLTKDPLIRLQREKETKTENQFTNKYACNNVYEGIDEIARTYGYAGVEPNTVLMGWSKKPENKDAFVALVNSIQRYDLNALFLNHHITGKKITSPTIDIWWSGWGRNLSLALNIVRYLSNSNLWNRSTIRLCIVLNQEEDSDRINRYIKNTLLQYRANVTIKIIDNHITQQSRQEIITTESADADLTIIGIPDKSYDDFTITYQYVNSICDKLSSTLFITASSTFEDHTVISQEAAPAPTVQKNEWILPAIPPSKYSEIADDIKKIDERGLQLVEALHKKIFITSLIQEVTIYDKAMVLAGTTISALSKVSQYDRAYQRNAAIIRTKKYFNNQIVQALEDVLNNTLPQQEELLMEGITWYMDQLAKDSNSFPKFKSIPYLKEEFNPRLEDSPSLRWFKFFKRVSHPLSRKTISLKANYREGASYFFRDLRYQFLTVLLHDLENKSASSREKFRHLIVWVDESLHLIANASSLEVQDQLIKDFTKSVKEKVELLASLTKELQIINKGRLQVESRKNVVFFMHQIERIDFNNVIKTKRRSEKFYETQKEKLSNFSASWALKVKLDLNTTKSSAQLNDYFGFVSQEIHSYKERLRQFFIKEQQQSVVNLVDAITSLEKLPLQTKQPSLPEWEFDYDHAGNLLREASEKLMTLANALPEENIITAQSGDDHEGLVLPIKAMVTHLTEATLTGPINDLLEELTENLKRSNLVINDLASLAMFNAFNFKEADQDALRVSEINGATRTIKKEMEAVSQEFESLLKNIDRQCSELQSALKLHNLSDISGEFTTLVRNRRKKHLQNKFSAKVSELASHAKSSLVSILYSQAKGILLAKQLSSTDQSLTTNERIMNLINSATPNQKLLQLLPHYYVSLFSGRSNIQNNFWIERPLEEKQFELAHKQYEINGEGFILVLGERNTGKSALCKHFSDTNSDNYTSYQLFSPDDGSLSIEDFDFALRKATKFEGDSEQILSLLPHNSLVIINDLELWWERSAENGLTLIRHIKSLIERFSSKCLFVINMNQFAYATINVAEPLDTHCAGVVRCLPFNSLELKQLIMIRHKSSGLALNFGSGATKTFSEIKLAQIFNKLFAYSMGNPGVAMNAWLTGIQAFSDKTILWNTPTLKDKDSLDLMPKAWSHLCLQLLLHKRMSLGKITRTVQLEREQAIGAIDVLRRLHIVSMRGADIYLLNPSIEFLLIANFKEKGWI